MGFWLASHGDTRLRSKGATLLYLQATQNQHRAPVRQSFWPYPIVSSLELTTNRGPFHDTDLGVHVYPIAPALNIDTELGR